MGYHLTILRTRKGAEVPISREEFEAAVRGEPNVVLDPDGVRARLFRGDEPRATLTWSDGEIWTKSPDDDVLAMLLQVANRLDARVRGDELETYRGVGDTYVHPDDRADRDTSERDIQQLLARRRLWNALRLAAVVITCGLLLLNALR